MESENELTLDKYEILARISLLPTDRHKALERLESVCTEIDPFSGHRDAASFDKNLPSDQEEPLLEKLYRDITRKHNIPSSRSEEIELALIESSYLLGNLELTMEHIDALLKKNSSNLFALFYQASIHKIYERYSDSRELIESILEKTEDDSEWQVRLLSDLGYTAYVEQDFLSSHEYYQQAISRCNEHSLISYLADIHFELGYLFEWLHDISMARENYQRSLEINESLDKRFSIAGALIALGNLHTEANDYGKSYEYLTEALIKAKTLEDQPTLGSCYTAFLSLYDAQDDWAKAIIFAERALVIYDNLENTRQQAQTASWIGIYHRVEGRLEEAESVFLKLLEIALKEGDSYLIINVSEYLHDYYLAITKPVVASKYHYLSEDTLNNVKRNERSLNKLLIIARHYLADHKLEISEMLIRRVLNIASEEEKQPEQAQAYYDLASVLEYQGQTEESKAAYVKCISIYESLDLKIETTKARNNLAHFLLSHGELEQAEEIYLNVLKQEEEFGYRYGSASTCCDLGHLYQMLGESDRAKEYFTRGKAEYEAIGQIALASNIDRFLEELAEEVV